MASGPAAPLERLLTAAEVAELLQVSQNKVYELATAGDLPSYKIRGSRRFKPAEVQAYLEQHCRERVAPVQHLDRRRR